MLEGLLDTADKYIEKGVDAKLEERLMGTSTSNQMKINAHEATLAREARRNSAMDNVAGLKAAGLSPVLATGGSFGSVSSGGSASAPTLPSARGGLGKLALESQRYHDSERELMSSNSLNLRADAELKREEARGMRIDNDNKDSANKVTSSLINDTLNDLIVNGKETSRSYNWAVAIKNSLDNNQFNMGVLNGFKAFLSGKNDINEYKVNELTNLFSYKILANQVYNQKLIDTLASVPAEQAEQIKEVTSQLFIKTSLLMAQLDQTNAETANIKAQKRVIEETARNLDTLIRSTHHKDLISMWEDGEYSNLFFGSIIQMLQSAPSFIGGVVGGKIGSGSFGKGGSLKNTPSLSSPKSNTPMFNIGQ